MINREIPFRPKLEGEFRVRFYNAASEITEATSTLAIAAIAEREIRWVENECHYNLEQRKSIVRYGSFSRPHSCIVEGVL